MGTGGDERALVGVLGRRGDAGTAADLHLAQSSEQRLAIALVRCVVAALLA
jgi:hypothetical protein